MMLRRRQPFDIWRCPSCGRILAEVDLPLGGTIRIKCGCNTWNVLQRPVATSAAEVPGPKITDARQGTEDRLRTGW